MSLMLRASCHCGAVVIEAQAISDAETPSRCTCSFCRRRQAGNVSAHSDSVRVVQGDDALSMYQFATRTARHYFCRHCGIYTHHQRFSNPAETGINFGCIDGEKPWEHEPMHWHDGGDKPSDG